MVSILLDNSQTPSAVRQLTLARIPGISRWELVLMEELPEPGCHTTSLGRVRDKRGKSGKEMKWGEFIRY